MPAGSLVGRLVAGFGTDRVAGVGVAVGLPVGGDGGGTLFPVTAGVGPAGTGPSAWTAQAKAEIASAVSVAGRAMDEALRGVADLEIRWWLRRGSRVGHRLIHTDWSFALLMAAWGSAAADVPDSRMVIS